MNCLRRSNITTVGELIGKGTKELLKLRNFGQKSYQEIEDRLAAIGLSLNPKTEGEGQEEVEEEKPRTKRSKAAKLAAETGEDIPGVTKTEDGEP
jgi:DNA-directed RNA polymerase subunit alpha